MGSTSVCFCFFARVSRRSHAKLRLEAVNLKVHGQSEAVIFTIEYIPTKDTNADNERGAAQERIEKRTHIETRT